MKADPLTAKRERLAAVMSAALAPKVFNPWDRDIRGLPDSELDRLLAYYDGPRYVN
jgi:hypothetical protein